MATSTPKTTPMIPLEKVRTTASTRNCTLTSRLLAPMALRNPISRVRSVTVVSIMFMIPMPPTMSDMPATAARSRVRVLVVDDRLAARSAWLMHPEVGRRRVGDLVAGEEQVGDVGLHLGHGVSGRPPERQLDTYVVCPARSRWPAAEVR